MKKLLKYEVAYQVSTPRDTRMIIRKEGNIRQISFGFFLCIATLRPGTLDFRAATLLFKSVSHAPDCLNTGGIAFQFLAQPHDDHINAAFGHCIIFAMDGIHNLAPGEYPALFLSQKREQLKGGQMRSRNSRLTMLFTKISMRR